MDKLEILHIWAKPSAIRAGSAVEDDKSFLHNFIENWCEVCF